MSDDRSMPFCTCGHSLYDHAVETAVDPRKHDLHGECFVGGCGCTRWRRIPDFAVQPTS